MRAHTIFPAAAVFLATAAGAQSVTIAKSDSGCVTTNGRVECRKVLRGDGNEWVRFDHAKMDSAMMKRAILGIEIRPTGNKRDTLGVFVESVIPKGPAETAGIVEGDRIASINGVDLRSSSADIDDPYTNGLAAHRLTREVQKLIPGSRVALRVYSGGRFRDVTITAARASDFPHEGGFRIQIGGPGMMEFNGGPGMLRMEGGPGMLKMEGGPGMPKMDGGPGGMDPAHLRMMIEEGMGHGADGHVMQMRSPGGAGLMRMRAPMPMGGMMSRRVIRI
jgi:hypothetical protein